jgi:class 3 adenylate cyclase
MTQERADVGLEPDGDPGLELGAGATGFRAFLLSDIRGYSSFASARGDEAAAALTGRFIAVAERVLGGFGGESIGNRGDEVLFAFESPRQAIRAAVAFEQALLDATREDPSLPMPAGVGIDVGEAVVVPDGWRANAINVAARLCSLAKGGEILATREGTHLAQAVDGIGYTPRPATRVKGIVEPVNVVRVVADAGDTMGGFAELGLAHAAPPPAHRRARRGLASAVVAAAALVAAAVVLLLAGGGSSSGRWRLTRSVRSRPGAGRSPRLCPLAPRRRASLPATARPGWSARAPGTSTGSTQRRVRSRRSRSGATR